MSNTHKCSCRWNNECFQLRKQFEEANTDDSRGKPCFRLNLSGDTDAKKKWRRSMLSNLGVDDTSVNIKCVNAAGRHWSFLKLQHFERTKTKSSTPMRHSDIIKFAHVADRRCSAKRGNFASFYDVPNYPIALSRQDSASSSHTLRLEERREAVINKMIMSDNERAQRKNLYGK